jgi:tRNA 2-selenouridine synthase
MVPPALWQAMSTAPRIELVASAQARARYLAHAYRDFAKDRTTLDEAFRRLPTPPGRRRLAAWAELADAGAFEDLALALVELHYDPASRRSARKEARALIGSIELGDLGPDDFESAADRVVGLMESLDGG